MENENIYEVQGRNDTKVQVDGEFVNDQLYSAINAIQQAYKQLDGLEYGTLSWTLYSMLVDVNSQLTSIRSLHNFIKEGAENTAKIRKMIVDTNWA